MKKTNVREPHLSQEQAENALERVYNAVHLPFDREAYRSISKRALRDRALRILVSLAVIAVIAVTVLGALGFFTREYLRNVVIQPQPAASTAVSPPGAADAWFEDESCETLVLQLREGDIPLDHTRTAIRIRETGAPADFSCDEAQGQLRLACPPEGATFEITVYDTAGVDYQIVVTVSAAE